MRKQILKFKLFWNYLFLKMGRIHTAGFVAVEPGVELHIARTATVFFGKNVYIRRGTVIDVAEKATLTIGDSVFIAHGVTIAAHKQLSIGADTLIGEYVSIRDHDHMFSQDNRLVLQGERVAPVIIEDNVWLGAKATVIKGVSIGAHSVVGANAVVTKNIPAHSVAAGMPAKVIKKIR